MDLLERDQAFFSTEFSKANVFLIAAKLRMECHTIGIKKTMLLWESERLRDILNAPACQEDWFLDQLASDMGITVEQLRKEATDEKPPDEPNVGDFINIPASNAHGCIFDIKDATLGSDKAILVLLQEDPDHQVKDMKAYRLKPADYEIDG